MLTHLFYVYNMTDFVEQHFALALLSVGAGWHCGSNEMLTKPKDNAFKSAF